MASDLPFCDIFVPQKVRLSKIFVDVLHLTYGLGPPPIKNPGCTYELPPRMVDQWAGGRPWRRHGRRKGRVAPSMQFWPVFHSPRTAEFFFLKCWGRCRQIIKLCFGLLDQSKEVCFFLLL